MTHSYLALILLVCACSARAQDAMTLPAECSDEPPAWSGRGARLPPSKIPSGDKGALLGTVSDRKTNRPLVGSLVLLYSREGSESTSRPREVGVDSLGGFHLLDLSPGRYGLRISSIAYRPYEGELQVYAGRADTLRAALEYFYCSGY